MMTGRDLTPCCVFLSLGLPFLILSNAIALTPEEIETQALALERELMAPCCYGGTVAGHDSGIVRQIRLDIREQLRQGMSPQQIKDRYVAQFGEQILAAPPARGFHMVAYVVPPLLLLGGVGLLVFVLNRYRRPSREVPSGEPDEALVTRIEQDLDRWTD